MVNKMPSMSRRFEVRGIPQDLPAGMHHVTMGTPEFVNGQEIVPLHYSATPTNCLLKMHVGN